MLYVKVTWLSDNPEDPIQFYHEIDDEGYETRKIMMYKNGIVTTVSETIEDDKNYLSPAPIPPIAEINEDGEFIAHHIEKDAFEKIWLEVIQP